MEVEDKVQIRKADLERYVATEAMEPTETVPEPEKKALLQSKVPAIEDGEVDPAKTIGSLQETKENLDKFIENLHKKAAGAIQWLDRRGQQELEVPQAAFSCWDSWPAPVQWAWKRAPSPRAEHTSGFYRNVFLKNQAQRDTMNDTLKFG